MKKSEKLMSEIISEYQNLVKLYGDGLYKDVMVKARNFILKGYHKDWYSKNKEKVCNKQKEKTKLFKTYKEFYDKYKKTVGKNESNRISKPKYGPRNIRR